MNNVVCILVDSVFWEAIGNNRCAVSPTPFIDSLKNESLIATNLYSHGPYTDAATRSLFTGRNCLDDFGYYFKWNTSPITHHKMFHDAGFETIALGYTYGMWGPTITDCIDKHIYTTGMKFGSEWGGIFAYYYDVIKNRSLDSDDYLLLKERFSLLFCVWIKYYDDLINEPISSIALKENIKGIDLLASKAFLIKEHEKFQSNPKGYIDDFLDKGLSHPLCDFNNIDISTTIDVDYLNKVTKDYKSLFRTIHRNNIKANLFRLFPSPKRLFNAIQKKRETGDSSYFQFLVNYKMCLDSVPQMIRDWQKVGWQNTSCSRFQLRLAAEEILPNRTSDKPFYLTFHLEEPHYRLAFFSYNIKDDNLIDEEMQLLSSYVNKLGTHFKGNLVYYLSLRYVDYCIEEFCDSLKRQGLWDNTTLLLLSDHGSSFSHYPLHNTRVNNFDEECYHIPLLIRHPGMSPCEIKSYQYSKDIFPTVFEILGLRPLKDFKGRSMLSEINSRDFVLSEYMGPGCPDLLHKRIWFRIKDSRYIVAYKVGIYENFSDGELACVYDLKNDPKGYYNKCSTIDIKQIEYLLLHIKTRFEEIKSDSYSFIRGLREASSF